MLSISQGCAGQGPQRAQVPNPVCLARFERPELVQHPPPGPSLPRDDQRTRVRTRRERCLSLSPSLTRSANSTRPPLPSPSPPQVYFAKDGSVSLGHYAAPAATVWKNAEYHVSKLAAICEIINLPDEFVSNNPYFVVNQLDWIQARYLLAYTANAPGHVQHAEATASASSSSGQKKGQVVKTVALDPKHPLTINNAKVLIPDVGEKLQQLEDSLQDTPEELNASDSELLKEPSLVLESGSSSQGAGAKGGVRNKLKRAMSGVSSGARSPAKGTSSSKGKGKERAVSPAPPEPDTFEPADAERLALVRRIPPPTKPSRGALSMITKEVKAMLKAQKELGPTKAGFYLDLVRSSLRLDRSLSNSC